jgi:hypothetical protein
MNKNLEVEIDLGLDLLNLDKYKCVLNEKNNKNKTRCFLCNIKLSLTEQVCKCKCDNVFCNKHLFSENHGCDFDYKEHGRKILLENNPCVKISKVVGI